MAHDNMVELKENMKELKDAIVCVKNREFNVRALNLECDKPELFAQCQWQKKKDKVSIIYLIYRVLHAFLFMCITGWSIWDTAVPETADESYLSRWPIYLTHWGITLCTAQAIVSLGVSVHRLVSQIKDSETYIASMSMEYKVYWVLHTTAVVVALGITGSYFVVQYEPGKQKLTALNISVHALNSVLMVIDLLVVSHPFRLLHCYWPFSFVTLYFCFTAVYFLSGGTGKEHTRHIYTALDWEKPGITFLVIFGGLLYVLLAHFLMWLLVLGRNKLGDAYANKYSTPAKNQVQPT